MSPWKATPPKDDRGYFERMTTHLFSAGLNWRVVENKKAGFDRAFSNFSPTKVAKFTERDVKRLMKDAEIVRNEKKIRATIHNAAQFLELRRSMVLSTSTCATSGKARRSFRRNSRRAVITW